MGSGLDFPCGSAGKESACNAGDLGLILGLGRSLEKGKATHSSILAWRIPWIVESMRLQRVGHDCYQDSMVLAQRQKYRLVERNRKPRDKSTHIWTPYEVAWKMAEGSETKW